MKVKRSKKIVRVNFQQSVYESLKRKDQKTILRIQSEIDERLIQIKVNIYEVGKLLSRAKNVLKHGGFQRWIEETFGDELPYSTAACWKAIYVVFENNPKTVRLIPTNFLIKMKEKSFPEEILNLANENPEAFKEADLNALKRAYKEFKNDGFGLDDFVELAQKQIKIGMAILNGENHLRHSQRAGRTLGHGFRDLRSTIKKMCKYTVEVRRFFKFPENAGVFDKITDHNLKVYMVDDIFNDSLIKDIDLCISEMERLKKTIKGRDKFMEQRLRETNGVIGPTYVDTKTGRQI